MKFIIEHYIDEEMDTRVVHTCLVDVKRLLPARAIAQGTREAVLGMCSDILSYDMISDIGVDAIGYKVTPLRRYLKNLAQNGKELRKEQKVLDAEQEADEKRDNSF
jgi:hypothetical protein